MNCLKKIGEDRRIYLLRQEFTYVQAWIKNYFKKGTYVRNWPVICIIAYKFNDEIAFMFCLTINKANHHIIRVSYKENIPVIINRAVETLTSLNDRK